MTLKVTGFIQFTNPCLVNTVSVLPLKSFKLAEQVTFTPDITTVFESVSQLYDIESLCGEFTIYSVTCPDLEQPNVLSGQQVVLDLNWNKSLLGSINCIVDYQSNKAQTYQSTEVVVWPSEGSLKILLTDPCATDTYMPVDFSETQSFEIDYTIC